MISTRLVALQTFLEVARFALLVPLGVGKRGKESKGKERAESKGKAKADAKGNKKREPSDLEKSLKGDKPCGNQVSRRPAIDATLSL